MTNMFRIDAALFTDTGLARLEPDRAALAAALPHRSAQSAWLCRTAPPVAASSSSCATSSGLSSC
jgi:hypothetical protein